MKEEITAIIQCPECGKEISDQSERCIHCGVPIYVCPKCGNLASGKLKFCPRCGNAVGANDNAESDGKLNPEVVANASAREGVRLWLKNDGRVRNNKTLLLMHRIMGCVFVGASIVIPIIIMLTFRLQSSLDKLLSYNTYRILIWVWLGVEVVFIAVWGFLIGYFSAWVVRCGSWLNQNKFDVKGMLMREPDELFSVGGQNKYYDQENRISRKNMLNVYFYAFGVKKQYFIWTRIVKGIFGFTSLIMLLFGPLNNAFMRSLVGKKMTSFTTADIVIFMVAMGIAVLCLVFEIIENQMIVRKLRKMRDQG